jgi:hypothetical protein
MTQAVPIKLMDALRLAQKVYINACCPSSSGREKGDLFDMSISSPTIKLPLAGLLDFWGDEVQGLMQDQYSYATDGPLLPLKYSTSIKIRDKDYDRLSLAREMLEDVKKVVKEYAPEWLR